jgi:lantibiotic modifying enzyme
MDTAKVAGISTARTPASSPAIRELLYRLENDRGRIAEALGVSRERRVSQIHGPLGDSHNGGRSVYRVSFTEQSLTDRPSIIYKPRSVAPESAFVKTLDWLARAGCEPVLPGFRVLPRGDYGWAEDISPTLYETAEHAQSFYRAQGALLAVFWLLGGGDANAENVIVSRDGPVWIDTECMCQPELACAAPTRAAMPDWIRESVLTTDMIYRGQPQVVPRAHTGLGVSCTRDPLIAFDEHQVMRASFIDAVLDGFRQLYRGVLAERKAWTSDDGPLAWWDECRVRVILRPTRWYCKLGHSLQAVPGDDLAEARRRVAAVLLSGEGTGNTAVQWPQALADAELEILQRGDVPYWTAAPASRDLVEASGVVVPDMLSCTGASRMAQRIEQASLQHLERQCWLIRTCLALR